LEAQEQQRVLDLANEVAQRFDPSRLGKIGVDAAGRAEKLDDDTRRRMESRIGGDFRNVRVIRGAFADRVTRRHGADALTIGATGLILVRETPRTNPKTPEGRAVLAHELTHVKQAQRGMHFKKTQGSDDHEHERKALETEKKFRDDARAAQDQRAATEAADPDKRDQRVVDRAIELYYEGQRLARDRRGFGDR
jgi:hypothetical protein